jgi:hypothetical protein
LTVASGDVDGVVNAIIRFADDVSFRKKCIEQVQTMARNYQWEALLKNVKV